ncbi:hypothetical protein C8J57DRAFT_19185 [Mycena rebaudengoi]|nr:hypothetical protein C8J57DRAFT_19185 [Mycena rebaudengoi]
MVTSNLYGHFWATIRPYCLSFFWSTRYFNQANVAHFFFFFFSSIPAESMNVCRRKTAVSIFCFFFVLNDNNSFSSTTFWQASSLAPSIRFPLSILLLVAIPLLVYLDIRRFFFFLALVPYISVECTAKRTVAGQIMSWEAVAAE